MLSFRELATLSSDEWERISAKAIGDTTWPSQKRRSLMIQQAQMIQHMSKEFTPGITSSVLRLPIILLTSARFLPGYAQPFQLLPLASLWNASDCSCANLA